jgi:diacylglycerol kinase family enzyme
MKSSTSSSGAAAVTRSLRRASKLGILKLGTGNALANLCGASADEGIVDDVLRARAAEVPGVLKLDLMVTEGKRTPFAGVGVDAGILNHYVETKRLARGPFSKLLSGGTGYAAAIGLRSIPAYAIKPRPNIEVRSRSVAWRVGPDGRPIGSPMGPGAILFRGPALIAAASTVPCYGYNFKLFPFAGTRRGMMHVRVADLPIPKIIPHIYPELWNGRWFPEGIYDFLAEDIEIRSEHKVPFQVGGDAEGYRDYARFSMAKEPIEMLDFASAERM